VHLVGFIYEIHYTVHVPQQNKENLLSRFHDNSGYANAPYCYAIHILSILLMNSHLSALMIFSGTYDYKHIIILTTF